MYYEDLVSSSGNENAYYLQLLCEGRDSRLYFDVEKYVEVPLGTDNIEEVFLRDVISRIKEDLVKVNKIPSKHTENISIDWIPRRIQQDGKYKLVLY